MQKLVGLWERITFKLEPRGKNLKRPNVCTTGEKIIARIVGVLRSVNTREISVRAGNVMVLVYANNIRDGKICAKSVEANLFAHITGKSQIVKNVVAAQYASITEYDQSAKNVEVAQYVFIIDLDGFAGNAKDRRYALM